MPCSAEKIRPYFWFIPDYIRQGVGIENAAGAIPYRGIKLHPYVHPWDFRNTRHLESLHRLFDYAVRHELPVLMHTGASGIDGADRFEPFFAEYRKVQFILAHCRPLEAAKSMLAKYDNVCGDTAFVPDDALKSLFASGFENRIVYGTDFPITHYFGTKYPAPGNPKEVSLREQYAADVEKLSPFFGCKELTKIGRSPPTAGRAIRFN